MRRPISGGISSKRLLLNDNTFDISQFSFSLLPSSILTRIGHVEESSDKISMIYIINGTVMRFFAKLNSINECL